MQALNVASSHLQEYCNSCQGSLGRLRFDYKFWVGAHLYDSCLHVHASEEFGEWHAG
jgi:hypothetical protein